MATSGRNMLVRCSMHCFSCMEDGPPPAELMTFATHCSMNWRWVAWRSSKTSWYDVKRDTSFSTSTTPEQLLTCTYKLHMYLLLSGVLGSFSQNCNNWFHNSKKSLLAGPVALRDNHLAPIFMA